MKLSLNVEQAAWYVERDGATLDHAESDGTLVYSGRVAGGTYTFRVRPDAIDEFNAYRDQVYRRLAAKRRAS